MRDVILGWCKEGAFWLILGLGTATGLYCLAISWMKLLYSVSKVFKVTRYVVSAVYNSGELLRKERKLEQALQAAHDTLNAHMENCYECKNEQTWCDDGKPLYTQFTEARFKLQELLTSLNTGRS